MQCFRLQVGNNVVVTGAHSIPAGGSIQPTSAALPLVVGLHGGGYDHRYFDALPGYSAKDLSVALGVPFVSIDRPSYGGTTSVLPIPANSDFTEESAKVLNQSILPGIWNSFGLANRCSCMIILAHSFGVMSAIATAALHAGHVNPGYPLGGSY
ncbi:hypothetical protein I316_02597 [Kwoniella heveanensis BCC8398]|uniref:AB hydrolase-1 domain-containing protein n=1 Tax=Kwoniella heveanensis BCC8398 TaxID=1296120 RepID=A0A1B9GX65_9TREE|nr:hypothetical protein I316_02597 [Kwoniella heveanensis BCC8398]